MMIDLDNVFFHLTRKRQIFDEKLSPKKLVKKKFSHKESSKKLSVIFPPWKGSLWFNFLLRRRLLKNGYSVLEYEFPGDILSVNWKFTLENFNFIKKSATEEIEILRKKYSFQEVEIIGLSLGCINACMCARGDLGVDGILLVVPGHCLAESLWRGIGTKKIRQSYENKKIFLDDLKRYWSILAPENNITDPKLKKISIFLSRADKIVPFYCGKRLADKARSLRCDILCEVNSFWGHYLTIFLCYLIPGKFLSGKNENVQKKNCARK